MSRAISRYDQVLTVANLPDQLAHKGLVVFHEQDLQELGASPGDEILLKGGRKTTGVARISPSANQGIIYLDATTRLNASSRTGDSLEAELIARVRSRISAHVAPRRMVQEASLPMTATGKIVRRALRPQ